MTGESYDATIDFTERGQTMTTTTSTGLPTGHLVLTGSAGTGKSTKLREIADAAQAAGWEVTTDLAAVYAGLRNRTADSAPVLVVLDGLSADRRDPQTETITRLMRMGRQHRVTVAAATNAGVRWLPGDWRDCAEVVELVRAG